MLLFILMLSRIMQLFIPPENVRKPLMFSGDIKSCRILENIVIIENIAAKWVKSVFANYLHIMNSLQIYSVMS